MRRLPRRATRLDRYELQPGFRFEIMALTFGRARIVATDGVMVSEFW